MSLRVGPVGGLPVGSPLGAGAVGWVCGLGSDQELVDGMASLLGCQPGRK